MTSETYEHMRSHIESLIAAFNEHDVDKVLAHFSEDVVWEDPSLPAPVVGRAGARGAVERIFTAFPDLQFLPEPLQIYVEPSTASAVSTWTWVATMAGRIEPPGYAPTGQHATVSGACRYQFRDGLIEKHYVIYDVLGLLQQLHLMPATDSLPVKAMAGAQRLSREVSRAIRHR